MVKKLLAFCLVGSIFLGNLFSAVNALSADQKHVFDSGIHYFDTENGSAINCSLSSSINSAGIKINLATIAQTYGIKWAQVKQIGGPVVDSVNPDQSPPTVASILKIIMADAFFQTNPDLGQKWTVTTEENYFKSGGADGSLKNPKPGQRISLGDALQQTLQESSDTDANILIDAAGGLKKVNSMMGGAGI